ncbi:hypothetical protein BJ165DRAFT_1545322 [Panaeolus papilionaceus]|nr:hypothetical protein BJ165DRAFT_1545322 [Panaeolus papilionaceus]
MCRWRAIAHYLLYLALKLLLEYSSPEAFHNSRERNPPPKCLPGTRTSILQATLDAINGSSERSERLLYLYGRTGMGKSAIAQTVTEALYHTQRLAAAFFASRNHQKTTFVTTIAYQLTQNIPVIRPYIKHAIERNPAVFHLSLHEQAKSLILDPFRQLPKTEAGTDASTLPHVIVIDGLDHLYDSNWKPVLNVLLQLLRERETFPFTALVTSRSSSYARFAIGIGLWFRGCSDPRLLYPAFEHDLDAKHTDIATFVDHEMDDIKQSHPLKHLLPDDWPSVQDKSNIVCRSEGQFLTARTIMQYVRHGKYVPSDRLHAALSNLYSPRYSLSNPESFLMLNAFTIPVEHSSFLEYDQLYLNKRIEQMKAHNPPVSGDNKKSGLPFPPSLHPSTLPDSSPYEVLSTFDSPFQVIDNLQGTPLMELIQPSSEFILFNQFNHVYGRRIDDYTAWDTLCTRISVKRVPSTIEECKKIVKRTHVNLVDLTQATKPHSRVQVFHSEEELREYTISSRKFFPHRNVYAGDVLKYLLRKILVFEVDNNS